MYVCVCHARASAFSHSRAFKSRCDIEFCALYEYTLDVKENNEESQEIEIVGLQTHDRQSTSISIRLYIFNFFWVSFSFFHAKILNRKRLASKFDFIFVSIAEIIKNKTEFE